MACNGAARRVKLAACAVYEARAMDDVSRAELRRTWRLNWLGSIHDISSFELQTATWLDRNLTNPYWSYIEFVESYFDRFGETFEYKLALKCGLVTPEEVAIVKDLHGALRAHEAPNGDQYDHVAILADPSWHRVVGLAEQARRALLRVIEDPDERVALSSGDTTW
jgi:hypothetical protein